jgi:hypothetical protein
MVILSHATAQNKGAAKRSTTQPLERFNASPLNRFTASTLHRSTARTLHRSTASTLHRSTAPLTLCLVTATISINIY